MNPKVCMSKIYVNCARHSFYRNKAIYGIIASKLLSHFFLKTHKQSRNKILSLADRYD